MKSLYPLIALVALAACNQNKQPDVVETRAPDPNAAAIANAAPVELPPAIRAQKAYRCQDQSLLNVTWFVGDKQAAVRHAEDTPVLVKSEAGGTPWAAENGATLSGNDTNVTFTPTGGKALVCHT